MESWLESSLKHDDAENVTVKTEVFSDDDVANDAGMSSPITTSTPYVSKTHAPDFQDQSSGILNTGVMATSGNNLTGNRTNVAGNETNVTGNRSNITGSAAVAANNLSGNETNVTENRSNITGSVAFAAGNQTGNEANFPQHQPRAGTEPMAARSTGPTTSRNNPGKDEFSTGNESGPDPDLVAAAAKKTPAPPTQVVVNPPANPPLQYDYINYDAIHIPEDNRLFPDPRDELNCCLYAISHCISCIGCIYFHLHRACKNYFCQTWKHGVAATSGIMLFAVFCYAVVKTDFGFPVGPPPWQFCQSNSTQVGNKTIHFELEEMELNYTAAAEFCHGKGAKIWTIEGEEEWEKVMEMVGENNATFWLDIATNGTCSDGSFDRGCEKEEASWNEGIPCGFGDFSRLAGVFDDEDSCFVAEFDEDLSEYLWFPEECGVKNRVLCLKKDCWVFFIIFIYFAKCENDEFVPEII